jgi:hypothetical protein
MTFHSCKAAAKYVLTTNVRGVNWRSPFEPIVCNRGFSCALSMLRGHSPDQPTLADIEHFSRLFNIESDPLFQYVQS